MINSTTVILFWICGLAVAIGLTIWHWIQVQKIKKFHRERYEHVTERRLAAEEPVLHTWERDAGMLVGLNVLLIIFVLERMALHLEEPGNIGHSPLQLGLGIIFLIIMIWLVRWAYLNTAEWRNMPTNDNDRPKLE